MSDSFAKDTDGFLARHFDRKISGAISRQLLKTPITPNQITLTVTGLGVFSGVCMAAPGYEPKVWGALLFLGTSILDGCDGEIARAKKMTSRLGGWLDLWGDNIVHIAVFYGLGMGLYKDTGLAIYQLLGSLAALGTLISASLASYQTYRKLRHASPPSPLPTGEGGPSKTVGEASLFTSVVGDASKVQRPWQTRLVRWSDTLARRDFIYGVVVLALIGRLEWFLWACSIGVNVYALVLTALLIITPRMKYLRILGLLIGVLLVLILGHEVGWASIHATLTLLGWKYLIVIIYPITWMTLNTAGWYYARHPDSPSIPFRIMMGVRLAGEAFNSLLPSGYIGGEPVKAKLLSTWTPLREATASVMIAKAAQSVGLLLFIGLGLAIGIPPSASTSDKWKAWIALGLLTTGISIFILLLANGSFSRLGRFLHRITRWNWLKSQENRLIALDELLGSFYRECKGRFLASILWHGAGWIAGMFELVIIFKLMGVPISWQQAWFMGALAQLGSVLGLISPGGLGFYEGGHYMAALILGLPPSLGVSASLIRRMREIFWSMLGLYFFERYSKLKPAAN